MPSNTHSSPKPIRSTRRPRGSAARGACTASPGLSQFLEAPHSSQSSRNSAAAMSPWCSSADRNAATRVGSAGFSPEFMPGTARAPSLSRLTSSPPGRKSSRHFRMVGQIMISSMNAIVTLIAIRQPTVTAPDASR